MVLIAPGDSNEHFSHTTYGGYAHPYRTRKEMPKHTKKIETMSLVLLAFFKTTNANQQQQQLA